MPGAIGVISLYIILLLLLSDGHKKISEGPCICYTALGDSIAWGLWGNLARGYVHHLRDFFKSIFPNFRYKNLAQLGATSTNLLNQLRTSSFARKAVRDSSIITICIGGNNLLRAVDYKRSILNESMAQVQVMRFIEDWQLILHEIRQVIGSRAVIYVMTLYNPCTLEDPAYEIFDQYLQCINSAITDLAGQFSYQVIDVYTLFESNPLKTWTNYYNIPRNIHPTDEGHKKIYLLHRQSL